MQNYEANKRSPDYTNVSIPKYYFIGENFKTFCSFFVGYHIAQLLHNLTHSSFKLIKRAILNESFVKKK